MDRGAHPANRGGIENGKVQREAAVIIAMIHVPGEIELLVVARAAGSVSLRFCTGQGRQKQTGEDCNNRNDDQELNEREGGA